MSSGNASLWYYGGALGDGGAIAGSVALDFPVNNTACTARATYLAEASQAVEGPALRVSRTYEGSASSGVNPALRGSVTINTGTNPHVIDQLLISYEEGGCSYPVEVRDVILTRGKMFQTGVSTADRPDATPSVAGVTQGPNRMAGAFSVPAFDACPAVAGVWNATLVALEGEPPPATPTPSAPLASPASTPATSPATTTPPPAAATPATPAASPQVSGAGTISVRIPPTGIGLAIFAGGTNSQLTAAAGCSSLARAAFWVSDGVGGFVTYVPASSIAVVNAAWNAKFVTGIPPTTAIIARCS